MTVSLATTFTVSPEAVTKIRKILEEQDDPAVMFRVFVHGGGCSGIQYGFTLDTTQGEDDSLLDVGGATIVIDAISGLYLSGAEIVFVDELTGSMFKINNPSAQTACACRSSFSGRKVV